jgi:hypothetical protein
MVQIQAHQGYFQSDGRLIFNNTFVKPPKNKKVTIFWEEEIVTEIESITTDKQLTSQQQTVSDILASLESIKKENFTPEDLESFERLERGDFKLKFEERYKALNSSCYYTVNSGGKNRFNTEE